MNRTIGTIVCVAALVTTAFDQTVTLQVSNPLLQDRADAICIGDATIHYR